MPKMKFARIRELIEQLPADPTQPHLLPIARILALCAAQARYPEKSLSAFRRHRTCDGVEPRHLDEIIRLARDELTSIGQGSVQTEATAPNAEWYSVERTAHALRDSPTTIAGRLRSVAGRRSLGWPWWDGSRWKIPAPAIDPATRAAYMASIPLEEPPAHVAALPPWCER